MISLLIDLLVFCIITGVIYYVIGNFCPAPMQKFAYGIFYVVMAILVCYWLLGFAHGGPSLHFQR